MAKPRKRSTPAKTTAANVGYEAELWRMADALPKLISGELRVTDAGRFVAGAAA